MAYWLLKSEPDVWSWKMQQAKGDKGEEWTGVRNYQARKNMREMKKGDKGFFYHTGDEKAVVGIVEVVALAHPDSTDKTGEWECVDVKAVTELPKPVPLTAIKTDKRLKNMVLVKNSRLSVQPVTVEEWHAVCEMGGLKLPPRLT
jgi:predicted RNA-binding protein with PUA-like domain